METTRPMYQEATEMATRDEYYEEDGDAYDDHQEAYECLNSLNLH